MTDNFTIPVVIDPAIIAKLDELKKITDAIYEGIEELKKIKTGTGLAVGVNLDEEAE